MRARAADVGDVVPDHRAVDVVGAALEHQFRHRKRLHDPERLRVRHVVEHQPADRERAEILETARAGQPLELARVGEEGQRNDRLEVAAVESLRARLGLPRVRVHRLGSGQHDRVAVGRDALGVRPVAKRAILLLPEDLEMREAILAGLDVAVEHRRVAVEPELVRDAMHVEPLLGADLALERLVVDAVVEDLGPASGKRAETGVAEILEHAAQARLALAAALGDPLQVHDLDRGERLEVHLRRRDADRREHLGVEGEGQVGMQAAHDVQFGRAGLGGLHRLVDDARHVHLVGAVVAAPPLERAEAATQSAHVRVVDVAIDVVVGEVAVQPAPHEVRQSADRMQIGCLEEDPAVLAGEPTSGEHLLGDRQEPRIAGSAAERGGQGQFGRVLKGGHL